MITEDVIILTYLDNDYKILCKKGVIDIVNNCISTTHGIQTNIGYLDYWATKGFSSCGYLIEHVWIDGKRLQELSSFEELMKTIGLSIHKYKMTKKEVLGHQDHTHVIYKAITGEELL